MRGRAAPLSSTITVMVRVEEIQLEQKLYSIITPVHNSGPKIEKTIQSVLSQRKDLFEFIIMDGGSTDETLNYIETYKNELTLVSRRDQGVYDAMNKGIELASGKYIYFLGAGDCLRPYALEEIESFLPVAKRALIYGNVYWVDEAFIYGGEFTSARLKTFNICHQAIFYERSIFEVVGRFEARFKVLADYVHNIKCFADDRIQKKYIDYVIANFEGGGLSARQKDSALIKEHAQLVEKYLG